MRDETTSLAPAATTARAIRAAVATWWEATEQAATRTIESSVDGTLSPTAADAYVFITSLCQLRRGAAKALATFGPDDRLEAVVRMFDRNVEDVETTSDIITGYDEQLLSAAPRSRDPSRSVTRVVSLIGSSAPQAAVINVADHTLNVQEAVEYGRVLARATDIYLSDRIRVRESA